VVVRSLPGVAELAQVCSSADDSWIPALPAP
jgi:hypothetical protein